MLSKSYTDIELIIINDGSSDASLDILGFIKDTCLKNVSYGNNIGLAARLNQKISMESGECFIRMDAEDIMFPDGIQK